MSKWTDMGGQPFVMPAIKVTALATMCADCKGDGRIITTSSNGAKLPQSCGSCHGDGYLLSDIQRVDMRRG